MTLPQVRVLRNNVFQAEKSLVLAETHFGKNSDEYRLALRKFVQLWSVLKMSHSQEEFLREVIR